MANNALLQSFLATQGKKHTETKAELEARIRAENGQGYESNRSRSVDYKANTEAGSVTIPVTPVTNTVTHVTKGVTNVTIPVTRPLQHVTDNVTSEPTVTQIVTVNPGDLCPTCGHRVPMTAAQRKAASRQRKLTREAP